ncbi:DNA alkylation repair protein [uncultured Lacinutrix sp.]|uniref:DNA alkylation repair protein n=1 Tax=uncultured Lacinutrix sp. TaxID=574032 RepID=UPI00260383FA|nr:DNA alkylation repair protein [uncultured Lacinutrix sp.]
MTLDTVLSKLHELAEPEKVLFKQQKFGVIANNALGIYHKHLKILAKEIGVDNNLAIQLFDTNIYEARLLCSKIYNPKTLTNALLEKWVVTFENWEIVDSFCMALVAKSKFALPKIHEWTKRELEFEKRSGFTTMAAYCMADKIANNTIFESFFPIIENNAYDDRIYVKKAVNWALRSIGKRNKDLNVLAINSARRILKQSTKSAKWIANDALKELQNAPRISDYPRHIYRP